MNREGARLQPMRAFQPFKRQSQSDMDMQVIIGKPEWDEQLRDPEVVTEISRPSTNSSGRLEPPKPQESDSLPVQAPVAPKVEIETTQEDKPAAPDFLEAEGFEDEDLW